MADPSGNTTAALVNGLGVASLGLGVSELLARGKVAALAGVDDTKRTRRVIRAHLRRCSSFRNCRVRPIHGITHRTRRLCVIKGKT
jgi:hypothetical protein